MGRFNRKKKPDAPAPAAPETPQTPPVAPTPASTPAKAAATPPPAGAAPAKPAAATPAAAAAAAPAAGGDDVVEAMDNLGRRVRLTRSEYRTKVLPELLKAHGSDADRLTAVIMQAVRDGLASEVLAAANRLTILDKDVERGLAVLAVVQRDAGELDSAEATLHELEQKRPQSAAAKVGLAMVAERRGDAARCEELLWQALQLDNNHPDAVHGWLQMRHRAVGDAGYRAELDKLVALPGTWRASLWLARFLLTQNDPTGAAAVYRDVLTRAGNENDALIMAASDLVQGRHHTLVQELITNRFQPGRHHPHIGVALLHHYLMTNDGAAGEQLLHTMYVHYGHLIPGDLQPFTAQFDRMRLSKLPPLPKPPTQPRLGLYRFDRPSWFAGLGDPTWLLLKKPLPQKQVLCFALALDGQPQLPAGQEDDLGRLVRGLPMLLAEQIWLSTPHRGAAVLPLTEPGGWAVMGQPWPEEQLTQQVPEAERADTLLVTGIVRVDGDRRRIDLWVYDCGKKQRIGHAAADGAVADLGKVYLQLIAELWPLLGGPAGYKPPVGEAPFWHRYAEGLAQHAALVVTQAGGMPRERLYGERYITLWLQQAALMETRYQPAFWLLASALGVLQEMGSKVPLEHARFLAEVFKQAPPNSAFARLAVVPLRACGLDAVWQARRPQIVAAAQGDQEYAAWLARVEATVSK
ncbi:MAG: hypothetical protein IT455_14425 [Planctomycetes bacterium]|nr:hypothetical protein [Planctomycetota bacterium]